MGITSDINSHTNIMKIFIKQEVNIMKEKIYTVPVNDAFAADTECPICSMFEQLENEAIEYTMGPSYMEDDIRAVTDKKGFCQHHIRKIYEQNNRLGYALVMKTHLDYVIKTIETYNQDKGSGKSFLKKGKESQVCSYIDELDSSCFVCDKIANTIERYIDTIFYMYKHDKEFKNIFSNCKGFCTSHYGLLMKKASEKLSGNEYSEFTELVTTLYIDNMKRVRDDVEWFINKFDHKYADAPWKNAKDSLARATLKDTGCKL